MNYSNEQDGYKMTDELDTEALRQLAERAGLDSIASALEDAANELDRLRQQPPAGEIYLDDFGQQCVELYDDVHKPGDKIYTASPAQSAVPPGFDVHRNSDGDVIVTRLSDASSAAYAEDSPLVIGRMGWLLLSAMLDAAPSAGRVQNNDPHEKALRELDDWLLEAIRCADTIFGVNTPEGALQAARTALRDICNDHGVKL